MAMDLWRSIRRKAWIRRSTTAVAPCSEPPAPGRGRAAAAAADGPQLGRTASTSSLGPEEHVFQFQDLDLQVELAPQREAKLKGHGQRAAAALTRPLNCDSPPPGTHLYRAVSSSRSISCVDLDLSDSEPEPALAPSGLSSPKSPASSASIASSSCSSADAPRCKQPAPLCSKPLELPSLDIDLKPSPREPITRASLILLLWNIVSRGATPGNFASAILDPETFKYTSPSSVECLYRSAANPLSDSNAKFDSKRRINYGQYEAFHTCLHRSTWKPTSNSSKNSESVWIRDHALKLARLNWKIDSGASGTMSRESFEKSISILADAYARITGQEPIAVPIRLLCVGAGLPDDLGVAFLLVLIEQISTADLPWPSRPSPRHIHQNQTAPTLRRWIDVPLSCTAPGELLRALSRHQLTGPGLEAPAASKEKAARPSLPFRRPAAAASDSNGAAAESIDPERDCGWGMGSSTEMQKAALHRRLSDLLAQRSPPPRPPRPPSTEGACARDRAPGPQNGHTGFGAI